MGICARYATVTKAELLETQSALLLAQNRALLRDLTTALTQKGAA